jgi:hypothetical protein
MNVKCPQNAAIAMDLDVNKDKTETLSTLSRILAIRVKNEDP